MSWKLCGGLKSIASLLFFFLHVSPPVERPKGTYLCLLSIFRNRSEGGGLFVIQGRGRDFSLLFFSLLCFYGVLLWFYFF